VPVNRLCHRAFIFRFALRRRQSLIQSVNKKFPSCLLSPVRVVFRLKTYSCGIFANLFGLFIVAPDLAPAGVELPWCHCIRIAYFRRASLSRVVGCGAHAAPNICRLLKMRWKRVREPHHGAPPLYHRHHHIQAPPPGIRSHTILYDTMRATISRSLAHKVITHPWAPEVAVTFCPMLSRFGFSRDMQFYFSIIIIIFPYMRQTSLTWF